MDIRTAGTPELSILGLAAAVEAYVIPYFCMQGKLKPFYRARLFNYGMKYKQPKETSNHIYFPKKFSEVVRRNSPVIVCEGEKKAALLVKHGIAACALGGVDSWKNRTIILPKNSELGQSFGATSVRLPAGDGELLDATASPLAAGLRELVQLAIGNKLHVVVAFDSDIMSGVKFEVQRAAAQFAHEVRYLGVPYGQIHQLILPALPSLDKTAVDDFIISEGIDAFKEILTATLSHPTRSFFPCHPNPGEFVNKGLQRPKLSRKDSNKIALAVLSDLDANGQRLKSNEEGQLYYFDHTNKKLIKASLNLKNSSQYHSSDFGQMLYNKYTMSAADGKILNWLDIQFNSEQPINPVTPYRIIARPKANENVVRYQINDGQYVKITSDPKKPIQILDNGSEGYLFESGYVEPIDAKELKDEIEKQLAQIKKDKCIKPYWLDVLDDARLRKERNNKAMIAMLFYANPWLYKWKGMQLPVEIILGEAGSGKSSLYEHRLNIQSGRPELRNAPGQLKDWHASITNTGGLHVTDNVQLLDKNLRQRLSDDICRLVTEPNPHIEMRKLYTDNDLTRIPVNTTFAITAIQQPFYQADLLQRSIIIELDKQDSVEQEDGLTYRASWAEDQMVRFGGRTAWLAHHMIVLHKFFVTAEEHWNDKYKAAHRLNNLEQTLVIMGRVFGIDMAWLPGFLSDKSSASVSGSDWTLQGLMAFAEAFQKKHEGEKKTFGSKEISLWCSNNLEYMDCMNLTNTRSLGRYLKSHQNLVASMAGIHSLGKKNNYESYEIRPLK